MTAISNLLKLGRQRGLGSAVGTSYFWRRTSPAVTAGAFPAVTAGAFLSRVTAERIGYASLSSSSNAAVQTPTERYLAILRQMQNNPSSITPAKLCEAKNIYMQIKEPRFKIFNSDEFLGHACFGECPVDAVKKYISIVERSIAQK